MAVVAFDSAPNNKRIVGLVLAVALLGAASIGLAVSLNELSGTRGQLNAATLDLTENEAALEVERATSISLGNERDSLSSAVRETGQQLEDSEAALKRERAERAGLEDTRNDLKAENTRYSLVVSRGDQERERLQVTVDSLSRKLADVQGRYDTLFADHRDLSETADTLTVDVAFYRLAHESYARLEERSSAEHEYSELAISLCGSVEAVSNCPTDQDGLNRLEAAYARYTEAHEAALAAYNAYSTAYQERRGS